MSDHVPAGGLSPPLRRSGRGPPPPSAATSLVPSAGGAAVGGAETTGGDAGATAAGAAGDAPAAAPGRRGRPGAGTMKRYKSIYSRRYSQIQNSLNQFEFKTLLTSSSSRTPRPPWCVGAHWAVGKAGGDGGRKGGVGGLGELGGGGWGIWRIDWQRRAARERGALSSVALCFGVRAWGRRALEGGNRPSLNAETAPL